MQASPALARTRRSSSRSSSRGKLPVAITAPRMPPSRTSKFEPNPNQWTGVAAGSSARMRVSSAMVDGA